MPPAEQIKSIGSQECELDKQIQMENSDEMSCEKDIKSPVHLRSKPEVRLRLEDLPQDSTSYKPSRIEGRRTVIPLQHNSPNPNCLTGGDIRERRDSEDTFLSALGEQYIPENLRWSANNNTSSRDNKSIKETPSVPETILGEKVLPSATLSDKIQSLYRAKFKLPSMLDKKVPSFPPVKAASTADTIPSGSATCGRTIIDPVWEEECKGIRLYNILLLAMLSLLMFSTGVHYNISQMVSHHQSCEWKVSHTMLSLEPTFLVAVIGISAFGSGLLSDKFGRKPIMLVVTVMLSMGIIIAATAKTLAQYETGRLITGASIGSLFNLCIITWLESSPVRFRKLGILVLMICSSLGHASIVFFDIVVMVHYGWRWGMVSTLIFVFPVFFLLYVSHETPLFLLASGREMEASIVARKCAMIPHDMSELTTIGRRCGLRELFSRNYCFITISLILLFGLHRLVEIGLIFGVPHLLATDYCLADPSSATNSSIISLDAGQLQGPTLKPCLSFSNFDYLFIFTFALLGIPGYFIGALLQSRYLKLPVRYAILILTIITGILLVWCAICDFSWLLPVKLGLVRIFISGQDQIFSVLVPAVFPTRIRNGASGFVRACGIILSSSGPFLTIWGFNTISVTWCLVLLSVIYFARIPLTIALRDTDKFVRVLPCYPAPPPSSPSSPSSPAAVPATS